MAEFFFGSYERKSLVPDRPETICVVDDDTSVLKALGRLLCSAGLHMMGFSDPRLFLEHAKDHQIALVIIDVWMPELSGLEVQRLLRTIAPATPVIIMTARDSFRSLCGSAALLASVQNSLRFLG